MTIAIDLTQADLEAQYPPLSVRQIFCDNGSATAGPRLATAISIARRELDAVLLKGWGSIEQIAQLVANDPAIKALACRLVMAEGAALKPEWSGPDAPYADLRKDTMAVLELLATAQKRSAAEDPATGSTAGKNTNARGQMSPTPPTFMFVATRDRPRRGGY